MSVGAAANYNSDGHYHGKCSHKKYRLTCEQIDALRTEADGRCQICGKKERYCAGFLRIDHDKKLGYWAVRGLLCGQCNQGLERGWLVGPEVVEYLANPWHRNLPGSGEVQPEEWDDFPVVDKDTAFANVGAAAEVYWQATRGHGVVRRQDARLALIKACRIARNAGWRIREVARATGGLWSTGYVQVVCAERLAQPRHEPV